MAEVQPLYWTATPAAHSGYGEGKLPDRYRSACMFRSDRTTVLHAYHRDRCRRRYSSFYPGIQPVTPALLYCYQVLQDRHRSSSTGRLTGSGHKRAPRPAGTFSTRYCFLHQPVMQGDQQRLTSGLPGYHPFSCREAPYCFFDCVQLTDTFQGSPGRGLWWIPGVV